jgi:hypothetical protein
VPEPINPTDGLKPGRIVYFVFDETTADAVNRRRTTGASILQREDWPMGAQAHIGNPVLAGDICPAMVVKVWPGDSINLKVMLDGSDTYWATSVTFSDTKQPRTWHWMFEGQNTRYQPDRAEKVNA